VKTPSTSVSFLREEINCPIVENCIYFPNKSKTTTCFIFLPSHSNIYTFRTSRIKKLIIKMHYCITLRNNYFDESYLWDSLHKRKPCPRYKHTLQLSAILDVKSFEHFTNTTVNWYLIVEVHAERKTKTKCGTIENTICIRECFEDRKTKCVPFTSFSKKGFESFV